MKDLQWTAALILLSSLSIGPHRAAEAAGRANRLRPLPTVLYHPVYPSTTAPVWVDAREAILPGGGFSSKYLLPDAIASLRDQIQNQRGPDCSQLTEAYESLVNPPARVDISSATQTADFVAEATVTGKAYGFRQVIAGQLLRLKVERTYKGVIAEGEERFVFYPVATFQAGPYRICKTDRRYPAAPETGDRVLVFIPSVKNPKAPFLELLDDAGLVRILSDKRVELPRRFLQAAGDKKTAAPTTEDEVIAEIREALGTGARP